MPSYIVLINYPDGSRRVCLDPSAGTCEGAIISARRNTTAYGNATIYAMALADFIKHATPERRDYRVTRRLTQTVTITGALDEEDAITRVERIPFNTLFTENCEVTDVEVIR